MPVILRQKRDESIVSVADMQDGQIGVIIGWAFSNQSFNGRVVQRCGSTLFSIGKGVGWSWDNCGSLASTCKVRLLKKGEMLEVDQ